MKRRNIFDLVIVFLIAIIGTGAIIWHDERHPKFGCVQTRLDYIAGKECK